MSLIDIKMDFAGQSNVIPRLGRLYTDVDLATLTTENFLKQAVNGQGLALQSKDFIAASYDGGSGWFNPSIDSEGNITLDAIETPGSVVGPVVSGNFAIFDGTSGVITDEGYSPSDATKTKVVMAGSAVVVARLAKFIDTAGTVDDTAGAATNLGDIYAGASATAGGLRSYPATAASGYLALVAANSAGDFAGIITNASLGQASTWTLADPAGAASKILQAAGSLVSGNLVKSSGTAGLMVDAGARIVANTTAVYGGGGTTNQFAATGLTVAAKGSAVIRASTNSVSITKALPGTNTLDITFSADPGANTTVDYIYTTASQA